MGLIDDVRSKKKQKEAENWFSMGIKSQDPEKNWIISPVLWNWNLIMSVDG